MVQAPNDKNQVEPMLGKIGALPEALGEAKTLLADTGYFSAGNVEACEKAGIEPAIAMGRQPHLRLWPSASSRRRPRRTIRRRLRRWRIV